MQVFEASFEIRITLDVVKEVSQLRLGQKVEALAGLGRAQPLSQSSINRGLSVEIDSDFPQGACLGLLPPL